DRVPRFIHCRNSMHGSEAADLPPGRKKLRVGQQSHGVEAVLLHGGEHCGKRVEARNDEQTKLQPECRTNRLKVIPEEALQWMFGIAEPCDSLDSDHRLLENLHPFAGDFGAVK